MFEGIQRPILIYGYGIHCAGAGKEAVEFAERTGMPVCLTWGAIDLFPYKHPLRVGGFGTHGVRYANFAIQNADLILSIGSRLDSKATGSPVSGFAPKAQIHMVDIDEFELHKFKSHPRFKTLLQMEAKNFLLERLAVEPQGQFPEWLERINYWKRMYPAVLPTYYAEPNNPYVFCEKLSDYVGKDDVIVSDTGCSLGWMMQAYKFKGERFIHAFNQTPMGYGLPAAIGAAFATGKKVVLVTGDGGLAVNVTEFATLARHQLPVKVVLFNNRGHAMCRQTQRTWLGGTYPSTSHEGGLATPDYEAVASAYGIPTHRSAGSLFSHDGPGFLNLDISHDYQITPQVRAGRELHDADPLLPRKELEEQMA